MRMPIEDFRNLTRVVLTIDIGYSCSGTRPQILAKQALSVRFVAQHCSQLVTFEMTPHLPGCFGDLGPSFWDRKSIVAAKVVRPLVKALTYMSAECKFLEVVKIPRAISYVLGMNTEDRWPYLHGAVWHEVALKETSPWLRKEAVKAWAKRTLHLLRTEGPIWDTAML